MYRVDVTSGAERILRDVPGLYERAREMLVNILETAEHIRFHGDGYLSPESVMRLRVGQFELAYTLDLDRRTAHVLTVVQRADGSKSSAA